MDPPTAGLPGTSDAIPATMDTMSATDMTLEIAAAAARLVVEEGMEYAGAKRRAARQLVGAGVRTSQLPDNDQLEAAVREYIAIFCADTQAAELAALRRLALAWMDRLAPFRPHLCGAVWRGTATRASAVHLELYADDSKAAEIGLLDARVPYRVSASTGPRGDTVDQLVIDAPVSELSTVVPVCLTVLDHDDLRGRLRPDRQGRSERGDRAALQALLIDSGQHTPGTASRQAAFQEVRP